MWAKMKPFTKPNIKLVPNDEGIYMFFDKNGNPLYVGVSDKRRYSGIRHRVESYEEKDDPVEHPTKVELRKRIAKFRWKQEPIQKARKEEHELKQSLPYNADKEGERKRKS